MGKKIRDTIHGYIYLSKIEEAVSQHPLFLRLHYVHQTSFTYLTYPNAHSTRYPHSLGVMHVAGEIFASALRNSPPAVIPDLVRAVRDAISQFQPEFPDLGRKGGALAEALITEALTTDLLSEPMYALAGAPGFKISADPQSRKDAEVFVPLVLLYQASRLAALTHDIGHPPFSHIVEYALLDAMPDEYHGHEPRGLEILDNMITGGELDSRHAFRTYPLFSRISIRLARYLLTKESSSPLIGIKMSLLDGPIDADRLDYVRRDAYSAGMVPTYDIRRLVDAAFFRKNPDQRYEIGYKPNCLSAFENFFIARYDLYRWMIYHHDVARRNLSIQRAVRRIVDPNAHLNPTIKKIGLEIRDMASTDPGKYKRFVDSYLLDALWQIDETLSSPANRGSFADEPDLKFYLDVVLGRRNDLLRSFLKGPNDYGPFVNSVIEKSGSTPPADARSARERVKAFHAALTEKFRAVVAECGNNQNVAKVRFAEMIEDKILERDAGRPTDTKIKVYAYYLGTFQAGPDKPTKNGEEERLLCFSTPGDAGSMIPVQSVSPTLAMLQEAWEYSPQLLLFYRHPDGLPLQKGSHDYDMLMESVRGGLKNFMSIV